MIWNLIWDVDGTLFDTYPAIITAFGRALAVFGVGVAGEEMQALADISMKHCSETLAARFNLPLEELNQRYLEEYRGFSLSQQPPYPGVFQVCQHILDRGGCNVIVTHRRPESTHALLAAHGLDSHFTDVISAEQGYPRKPHPAMFSESLRRNALLPAETLAVGDRELDIQAAQAAGLRAAFFRRAPLPVQADFIFDTYAELLAEIQLDT
jgi:HAD superfamily hydrolase (TIGR01549 family)